MLRIFVLLLLLLVAKNSFAAASIGPAFGTYSCSSNCSGAKLNAGQQGTNTLQFSGANGVSVILNKAAGSDRVTIQGPASLVGLDNTFSGSNTFSQSVTFGSNLSSYNIPAVQMIDASSSNTTVDVKNSTGISKICKQDSSANIISIIDSTPLDIPVGALVIQGECATLIRRSGVWYAE